MAVRTETETLDLIRAITKVGVDLHANLDGSLVTNLNALETEIAVGDLVPENAAITTAMNNFVAAVGRAWDAWKGIPIAAAPALGRLAGSPDLTNFNQNIDWFEQYMVDGSFEYEERGFVKDTAATVVGSGTGVLSIGSVDLNGDTIDYGHVEDFVLECSKDYSQGATAGAEEFTVRGEPAGKYPWQEGGSSLNRSYNYNFGLVSADFSTNQVKSQSGAVLKVNGPGSAAGNLARNGDFETPISGTGTGKLNNWTITAGDATITQEDTDPINGDYSLNASADFVMDQNLTQGRAPSGTMMSMAIKVERKSSATGNLTIRLMDQDEGVTHGAATFIIGSLTNDTPVVLALPAPFDIPLSAEDLKIQIELDTLAVGTIKFDDMMLAPAALLNGYTVCMFDGTTQDASKQAQGRFKKGDVFTVQTTSADGGTIEKYFNNFSLGRYYRSAVAATANWEDPA